MAKVAICMAMDIIYTVLLIRLGSNSLYRSANCSSLQKNVIFWEWNFKNVSADTRFFFQCVILPGWTSDLRLSVQEHQTAEVHCKLQQHRQHRVQIEYVW